MNKLHRRGFLKVSSLYAGVLFGINLFGTQALAGDSQGLGKAQVKVAVLSASGRAGKLITQEALAKGLSVTAFVRDSKKLADISNANLKVVQKDIFSLTASDLSGFDIIIDAFGEWQNLELHKKHLEHLASVLKGNNAKFLIVGGAGSLYMDKSHTTQLIDTPSFPDEFKPLASAQAEGLAFLRTGAITNWVHVSPPADFVFDAPKTGKYKIIGEEFEVNAKGESKGSYADYAAAMIEIALDPKYNKERVGVIGL